MLIVPEDVQVQSIWLGLPVSRVSHEWEVREAAALIVV